MFGDENEYDSEEDENIGEEPKHFKPTFVVIAIDTHPLMFRKKEDGSMPFRDCIEACYTLADSLILTRGRGKFSQFAIVLAREDSPVLTEFDDNLLSTIKLLKGKINMPDKQLADEYQRKEDFDLSSFFLTCKKVFHDINSAFYKRTLIYITDDDDPVQDAQKKFAALNEIKTFSGNQIDFQVIPTRVDFHYDIFYNELFSLMDTTPIEEICEDRDGLVEKLMSTVVMRHTQTKILFYPFKGDTSRFLNCFKLDTVHSATLLNSKITRDGKEVKMIHDGDTNPSFFFKNKVPGCNEVTFDSYEQAAVLDHNLPRGLTLLYVSKRSTEVGYVLGKPSLLRQNPKYDSPYFKKFWQCCVDDDRVLVCARKIKHPGKIRYVELIPVNVNGSSMFLVKNIPFTTEIVYPKVLNYPEQETDKRKKEAMKKLVDDLTFDFDVKMIPDPCYRKKQAYVKAKLLDEPMDEVTDVTFNAKALDKHLSDAVNEITSNYTLVEEKKRKAPAKAPRAKKAK